MFGVSNMAIMLSDLPWILLIDVRLTSGRLIDLAFTSDPVDWFSL